MLSRVRRQADSVTIRISRSETALTLRAVFGLALRQTEGLVGSIMQLLGIDLPVPDHTTFSRRAGGLKVLQKPRASSDPLHLIIDSTEPEIARG